MRVNVDNSAAVRQYTFKNQGSRLRVETCKHVHQRTMLLFSTRGWCPLLVINVQIFLVLISARGGHATHYTEGRYYNYNTCISIIQVHVFI